jgi:DNA-binding NtrC family response regulator
MTTNESKSVQSDGLVLVVDDDEGIRQFIGDVLDREGIPCATAGSVEEAIDALGNNKISLTLLDWGLRGGLDTSGAEVLQFCKDRYPLMPVIVMSGMPIDVRTDATTKQADGFLAKPFNGTLIVAHVNQWLNRIRRTSKGSLPQRGEDIVPIVPLNKLESRYIRHVVQLVNYDISLAAEKLGVTPEAISEALKDETVNG